MELAHDDVSFDEKTYQDALDFLKSNLRQMLFEIEQPMQIFTKKEYEKFFHYYCEKFNEVFRNIEAAYAMAGQKEVFLESMAEYFLDGAKEQLDKLPKNRDKEVKLIDYNMVMVIFFFPALLWQDSTACREFAHTTSKVWKKQFPQTNIAPKEFESISEGFKKKYCYITTAVCESLHKPDDCYELKLLRDYRDHYLMNQSDGEALVRRYYDMAPTIVKHINQQENYREIYDQIWEKYLKECIFLIEKDQKETCREIYQNMVYELQKKYFYKEGF